MEVGLISIRDEVAATPVLNDDPQLVTDDVYACTSCLYPVEILKIDDKENTTTFNCLNPNEKKPTKTIQISEYLDSIKKNTYLYSECSLCNRKQNEFKDNPIFSYCIKCDTVICSDCMDKHLKVNGKNHHEFNSEYIIKNNERSIKCLLHPKEKNLAFCLKCNIHICKECMKSQKHINHNKINIIEISVTNEIKNMLNDIINIYKGRIVTLTKEKEKMEAELYNRKESDKKKIEKQKKDQIEKIQKILKKELEENEKILNDNLYKLKLKYENDIKLCKNNFKISNENIIKKYGKLNIYVNKKFNEELTNLEKDYNNKVNNLEYNKKINNNKNLLSINQILKNTQENYQDNYYYNHNVYNIIFRYYESKDKIIKQLLRQKVNTNIYNELYDIEKEKQKYKNFIKEIKELKKLKNKNNYINDDNKITEFIGNIYNKNIIDGKNDENKIIMIYKINKYEDKIKVLDEEFVENNKGKCKFFINNKKYDISEYIKYDQYNINEKCNNLFTVILTDINTEINIEYMFFGCHFLTEVSLTLFNIKNLTNMKCMFSGCFSLKTVNLSIFNTQNVTSMWGMFKECRSLIKLDLTSFNTENVTNFGSMFEGCCSLETLDLSSFKTKNVTNMGGMFDGCSSLITLNLSSFNTSNVKYMCYMFYGCRSLSELNLSSFNVENVIDLISMFYGCYSLTRLNLSLFNLRKDALIGNIFYGCKQLSKKLITISTD